MRIMFVGDINLGEYYTSFGHGPKTISENYDIFEKVSSIFQEADIVCGNLEAPLTDYNLNKKDPESVVLRGRPSDAAKLKAAGFKVLQVANNHIVQHGDQGFEDTTATLKAVGIHPVGLLNEDPAIIEIDGIRVGFLAASDVPDNTNIRQTKYQPLNEDFISKVKKCSKLVDHLFVMLHWGLESSTTPMPYQKELIKKLSAVGVSGVIGSHPHLFYEVYFESSTVAAPSLGNFIFDLCWDSRLLKSAILDIKMSGNQKSVRLWPVELKKSGSIPTPSQDSILVANTHQLYNLGRSMHGEQARKLKYFFLNILRGQTSLKLKFFTRKIFPKMVRS